jgi:hypothetical protein
MGREMLMAGHGESEREQQRAVGRGVIWLVVSVVLAIAISVLLLLLPLGTSTGVSTGQVVGPGTSEQVQDNETHQSLLEKEGWSMVGVLLIPVALAAAPLPMPRRARKAVTLACTMLLAAAVFLGSASVGLFYIPVVITMAVAAATLP